MDRPKWTTLTNACVMVSLSLTLSRARARSLSLSALVFPRPAAHPQPIVGAIDQLDPGDSRNVVIGGGDAAPGAQHHPLGGLRPFHHKSTCLTQITVGPYVVQIWSRDARDLEPMKPSYSTVSQASEEVTTRSVLNTIHELVDIVQVRQFLSCRYFLLQQTCTRSPHGSY